MNWRSIKTAPKDGTRILLKNGKWVSIGAWSEGAQFGNGEDQKPGWQLYDCDDDPWYAVAIDAADYWMPLPE